MKRLSVVSKVLPLVLSLTALVASMPIAQADETCNSPYM